MQFKKKAPGVPCLFVGLHDLHKVDYISIRVRFVKKQRGGGGVVKAFFSPGL